jgi:hypothetical protein
MGSIKIAYVNIKLISLGINNFSSLAIWATVVFLNYCYSIYAAVYFKRTNPLHSSNKCFVALA